jgi:hypothetical protein
VQCGVQGPKVVGHRATKVCIMLDGCALASVRVARGLESVLGVGSEFVVFVLSVVRHVDINLARFATRGGVTVSSARTSGRRSAKEGASDAPYLGWKGGLPKTFSDALGGYRPRPAQEGHFPGQPTLPYSPMCTLQLELRVALNYS